MTVDKLTLGSTDLLALSETVNVTEMGPPPERYEHSYATNSYPAPEWATKMLGSTWQSVNDTTVRPEHRDLTSKVFVLNCTVTTRSPSFAQVVGRLKRRRCYTDDIFSNITEKAIRTYPKRMSRAKRKEARACEQRRRIKDNQWWSKR